MVTLILLEENINKCTNKQGRNCPKKIFLEVATSKTKTFEHDPKHYQEKSLNIITCYKLSENG